MKRLMNCMKQFFMDAHKRATRNKMMSLRLMIHQMRQKENSLKDINKMQR